MATPGVLPTSNAAGNNQTSPGAGLTFGAGGMGAIPRPIFQPVQTAGTLPSSNPMLSVTPTTTPTPLAQTTAGAAPGVGLYNTQTSPGQGTTDINKQLTDIFGKGIGGSLNNLLQSLSGTDSQVFQQWLAAQVPAQAQAEASARQGLASMGVSGDSSVAGLMEANLGANFNAQAAAENAQLMTQNIGTTQSILQNAQGAAAQEVATSPWTIASQVIGEVGQVAGDVGGVGGIGSMASNLFSSGGGATDPLNMGQWGTTDYAPSVLPGTTSSIS